MRWRLPPYPSQKRRFPASIYHPVIGQKSSSRSVQFRFNLVQFSQPIASKITNARAGLFSEQNCISSEYCLLTRVTDMDLTISVWSREFPVVTTPLLRFIAAVSLGKGCASRSPRPYASKPGIGIRRSWLQNL